MQITLDIPDDKVPFVVDAFCFFYRYKDKVPNPAFDDTQPIDPVTNPRDIDNPEGRNQFAIRMLKYNIKKIYYKYMRLIQRGAADAVVQEDFDSFDIT